MNKTLKLGLVGLAIALLGYGVGRYLTPANVVEVEKVVEKERVKTITVTKETTRPDGTVIKETKDIKDVKKEKEKDTSKVVTATKSQYFIVGGYGLTQNAYTLNANRRILGNLYAGVYGTYTDLSKIHAGVTIGYEF